MGTERVRIGFGRHRGFPLPPASPSPISAAVRGPRGSVGEAWHQRPPLTELPSCCHHLSTGGSFQLL